MNVSSRAAFMSRSTARLGSGVAAVTLTCAIATPAHAATLGHSRVLSKPGDTLAIDVQIRDITSADRSSLRVGIAPPQAWTQAGLTPPVALNALRVVVAQGPQASSSVIQVRSDQRFDGAVADLLLDVGSAAGVQRHQVSLLMPGARPVQPTALPASGSPGANASSADLETSVAVRRGDNLFALSRRHAPEGISIYQWMIAVHRANPKAFIRGDINLVKAGANLAIPDIAAMAALSDRQARRIFRDLAGSLSDTSLGQTEPAAASDAASKGQVSNSTFAAETEHAAKQDRLRLTVVDEKAMPAQGNEPLSGTDNSGQTVSERGAREGSAATGSAGSVGAEPAVAGSARTESGSAGTGAIGTGPAGSAGTEAAENVSANSAGASLAIEQAGGSVAGRQPGGASGAAADDSNQAMSESGALTDDELAVRKEVSETGGRVSQLEGNIRNLNRAMQAQGLAATTLVEDGANEIGQTLSVAGKALAEASAGADAILAVPDHAPAQTNKVDRTVSWLQDNLLAIVTIILAVLVLVLAWALRRASGARAGRDGSGGVITEAMVKEKLDQINFDLAAEDKPIVRTPKD
jgi:pilus assembly protein FimV